MLDKPGPLWHPSAPMSELAKAYEPQAVEAKWYAAWIDGKCFEADPSSAKDAYSIVIPPPNVTGILHLGHVLNNALQDILARRARQEGKEVLWLPGTDHAGIATQASRDAQSGPTYLVTSDSSGNLATTSFDVGGFQNQIDELGDGVAMALALGGTFLPAGKRFAITTNLGTFEGSSALGVSAVGQINDNFFLNGGAGFGFSKNSFGGRAGVTLAW